MSQVGCVVTHWIVGNEQDKGIPNAQSKNRIRNHMRRYSAFAIAREGARYHTGWERAWKSPAPKKRYDAIIVGAGGHGLATAYYLGKNHGIKNVAIQKRVGWAAVTQAATRQSSVPTIFRIHRPRFMKRRAAFMKR